MVVEIGRSAMEGERSPRRSSWRMQMLANRCWLPPKTFALSARICMLVAAAMAAAGCHGDAKKTVEGVSKPPSVKVTRPEMRTLVRVVGQPSFIESYERSSVYPKMTAYIDKWIVDIGDKVKKGQTLATLFVPELVEDFSTKRNMVDLDNQKVDLALKMVDVASANVEAAKANVQEAKAILDKFKAEVVRWDSQVTRLRREKEKGVVDPQVLLESENELRGSIAAKEAAEAGIAKAEAELLSDTATLAKAKVDVKVAEASLAVATSEAKRLEAWVGYLKLPAPFDGVITVRNANTFDFVLPSSGDPTALDRSPNLSPSGAAAPIYVVDRTDIVRIFVDIPEQDANYVKVGTKASVLAKGYRDEPILGEVTRTSWALNIKSRTLRAEVDLPNPNSELLPGMYAYVKMTIVRPNVHSVPVNALAYNGEKTFCWLHKDGKAVKTEVRTGVSDGKWIEVTNLQSGKTPSGDDPWKPVKGDEQVIVGDISALTDGGPVEIVNEQVVGGGKGTEVAVVETPTPKVVETNALAPARSPR